MKKKNECEFTERAISSTVCLKWEALYGAAHPHLLIFLTHRGHTRKCFTILNAFQTLLQHVEYCIDRFLGKEDEFSSEHFQKACMHTSRQCLNDLLEKATYSATDSACVFQGRGLTAEEGNTFL